MKKSVLITGVARGIGRGIAERFLNEGYELFGTFHKSEEKARELESIYGSDCVHLFGPYNFQNLSDTKALLEKLKSHKFNTIVSSAGMFCDEDEEKTYDDFNNFQLDRFMQKMNCNFYTPLLLAVGLKDNIVNGGSIVIISSNDAYSGAYASMAYSISKSALISLMKCLSVNYGELNVRVNSVAPGAINTDMNTREQMDIAPYFTPMSRVGEPIDVAKVVYFLASDEAAFVNGVNITIDGGYSNVSILLKAEATPALSEELRTFIPTQPTSLKKKSPF